MAHIVVYLHKINSDSVFSFRVKTTVPLFKLKVRFCNYIGIYKESARMVYNGNVLDENKTMQANGLSDGAEIHLHPVGNFEYWVAA